LENADAVLVNVNNSRLNKIRIETEESPNYEKYCRSAEKVDSITNFLIKKPIKDLMKINMDEVVKVWDTETQKLGEPNKSRDQPS
jgi:hypothetical protein